MTERTVQKTQVLHLYQSYAEARKGLRSFCKGLNDVTVNFGGLTAETPAEVHHFRLLRTKEDTYHLAGHHFSAIHWHALIPSRELDEQVCIMCLRPEEGC